MKSIIIKDIPTPARKYRTSEPNVGMNVELMPGHWIRLFGVDHNRISGPLNYDKTFKVGDYAEYDSYNLKYTGRIVAIGKKTVTIEDMYKKNRRLTLYEFTWRNRDYDEKEIADHNLSWTD